MAQELNNILLLNVGVIGVSGQLLVKFVHIANVLQEWTTI
jgi:hypothetical protein